MKKWNAKQWGLVVGSLVVAFAIQWVLWLLIMGHPGEIGGTYQILTTLCLASAFILVGDKFLKANLYK